MAPLPFPALAKKEHLFHSAPFAPPGADLRYRAAKKPAPPRLRGASSPPPLALGERTFWQPFRSSLLLVTAHCATFHKRSFFARAVHYRAAVPPLYASTTGRSFLASFFLVSVSSFFGVISNIYIVFFLICVKLL